MSALFVLLLVFAETDRPPAEAGREVSELRAPEASPVKLELRVALGGEWDTNAKRVLTSTTSRPGDALTRLVAELRGAVVIAEGHELELDYLLGAKRFFALATEDLLVHDLRAASHHRLPAGLGLDAWGTLHAARMRSGVRDYSLGALGLAVDAAVLDRLDLRALGAFTDFGFGPAPRYSYAGPTVGGEASWRPSPRLLLTAHLEHTWRRYEGNGRVPGTRTDPETGDTQPIVTFCEAPPGVETCAPVLRRDRELALGLRATYRGRIVLGGEYLARLQRSTSSYEEVDRHRLSVFATVPLPLELVANVQAALQVNSGISVSDTIYQADADENQNSVQVQLARKISDLLSAELRWALFANQFTAADVGFLRQTFYLGLSYRTAP